MYEVIFPLCHLCEWICPKGKSSYENKDEKCLTKEEILHKKLYGIKSYETVRLLCNNAKHYNDRKGLSKRISSLKGARVGLMRVGDSLGITHFMIDGEEVRSVFWEVFLAYREFFDKP